jgi:hypothetical protein
MSQLDKNEMIFILECMDHCIMNTNMCGEAREVAMAIMKKLTSSGAKMTLSNDGWWAAMPDSSIPTKKVDMGKDVRLKRTRKIDWNQELKDLEKGSRGL